MTYCVGLRLDRGLIFAADTRTNAGLDNIATFRKLHFWEKRGDRVLVLISAGNLAATQAVVTILSEQIAAGTDIGQPTLMSAQTMFQAARIVGAAVREVHAVDGPAVTAASESFALSLIMGGQIRGEQPRLFQIYSAGNFIEATDDTTYFQIGEHKYGKPILDRVTQSDMRLGEAAKLVLLSFDSTLRSNLSVGMPIDILLYNADSFEVTRRKRIEQNDSYFQKLSEDWSLALRQAFTRIDEFEV